MSKSDPVHTEALAPGDAARAGAILAAGGLVVFPTETVYGLGASAVDADAVRRVFAAKERPADNPLIVHFSHPRDVMRLLPAGGNDLVPLVEALMPGPFTAVVDAPPWAPDVVRAGLDSIAVRVPSLPAARDIIAEAGVPVAAPSANRSGRPSPTTFEMAWEEMAGRVAAIMDGGDCPIGIESTVVDLRQPGVLTILRPGQITTEELQRHSDRTIRHSGGEGHRSPGTKYRHYHPGIPVFAVPAPLWERAGEEARARFSAVCSRRISDFGDLDRYTGELYRTLWRAERDGAACILLEDVSDECASGLADRLHRAADGIYSPGMITAF